MEPVQPGVGTITALTSRDQGGGPKRHYRPGSMELCGLILIVAILLREPLSLWFNSTPSLQTWSTIFVSVNVQAFPFLLLGVVVSGAIAAFVPASVFTRILPNRPALAIPAAGACGVVLPGCECGSVPIASRLIDRGVRPSAALAFLLSAPAINPIVLVATAVAFAGLEPTMVWARLVAGLTTAVLIGWIWERIGRPEWMRPRSSFVERQSDEGGWAVFLATMRGDFTQAGGFLVLGAAVAATFKVLVSQGWMEDIGASILWSVLLMGLLAFMLALCSEADAFVAASFTTIPMVGKLVFLTVGPTVDIKLVALQVGTFGRRFSVRFAPLTFVVATAVAVTTGWVFWGGQA
jgi:uncharacterized membrane protein YraQ (UPF0718 family)